MAGLMQRPEQQAQQPQQAPQQAPQEDPAAAQQAQAGQDLPELEGSEPASPEEQAAYEQAMQLMGKILYESDKTHEGVMQLLKAEPGIAGVVKATTMLVAEIDKKINLPETVIMELPGDIVDRLIDLGQQAGLFQMSDKEMLEAAQMAVFETMRMYGMDQSDLQQMAQSVSEKDAETLFNVYNQMGGFE